MSQFFSRPTAPNPPSRPSHPPQKSHAIQLLKHSTKPRNAAIPTIRFQHLKGLHGNCMRHFRATTPTPGRHPPGPPFTTPPQKSHAIRLLKHSTKPRNAAIPTIRFQHLKGLHGNCMRHFSATTPNGARTRPHTPTRQRSSARPNPRAPATAPQPRHAHPRAPASSRASTHTPAQ